MLDNKYDKVSHEKEIVQKYDNQNLSYLFFVPNEGKPSMYMGTSGGIGGKGFPIFRLLTQEEIKERMKKLGIKGKKIRKQDEQKRKRRNKNPEDITSNDYSDEELTAFAKFSSMDSLANAKAGDDERLKKFAEKELKRDVRQKVIEILMTRDAADEEIDKQIIGRDVSKKMEKKGDVVRYKDMIDGIEQSKTDSFYDTCDNIKKSLSNSLSEIVGEDVDVIINDYDWDEDSIENVIIQAKELINLYSIYDCEKFQFVQKEVNFRGDAINNAYVDKKGFRKTNSGQVSAVLTLNDLDIKEIGQKIEDGYWSYCDEKNLKKSLVVHEFAHLMFGTDFAIPQELQGFHKELNKIYKEYKKEVNDNPTHPEFICEYATNMDEFMAECFQEYINYTEDKPRKYVKLVGELIDKIFKK